VVGARPADRLLVHDYRRRRALRDRKLGLIRRSDLADEQQIERRMQRSSHWCGHRHATTGQRHDDGIGQVPLDQRRQQAPCFFAITKHPGLLSSGLQYGDPARRLSAPPQRPPFCTSACPVGHSAAPAKTTIGEIQPRRLNLAQEASAFALAQGAAGPQRLGSDELCNGRSHMTAKQILYREDARAKSLVLTIDCMVANAPKQAVAGESLLGAERDMF
jgi:hypothetical protein